MSLSMGMAADDRSGGFGRRKDWKEKFASVVSRNQDGNGDTSVAMQCSAACRTACYRLAYAVKLHNAELIFSPSLALSTPAGG